MQHTSQEGGKQRAAIRFLCDSFDALEAEKNEHQDFCITLVIVDFLSL